MTRQEKRLLAICVALIVAGLAADWKWTNDHYFQRCGALITACGILFAALGLRDRLKQVDDFVETGLQRELPKLRERVEQAGRTASQAKEIAQQIGAEARTETTQLAASVSKRLLVLEVAALVLGTLIWGFGDWPVDALRCQQGLPSCPRILSAHPVKVAPHQ